MRIALGFFGITRSLKYVIASIKENILNVLHLSNIDYDIFVHTYYLSTDFVNNRTKERVDIKNIDNEEYKLLNANYLQVDDQETIKKNINLLQYRTHMDPWYSNYNSVDNFILAQYSKLMLTNMIEKSNNNYDYILFLRPDCLYLNKFDVNFLKSANDHTLCIPNFHLFGPYNFNDRFCIATMKTYKLYGDIFSHLLSISKKQPLHSETIIGELMSSYSLDIVRIPFKFARIRFGGAMCDSDKTI